VSHTVLSKRKLITLVNNKIVSGWDDPRLPTINGFKRKGYTPAAINHFCEKIGISAAENVIEMALLEHCVRNDLDKICFRGMAVLDPLKVILDNYDEGEEELEASNHPANKSLGTHKIKFSKTIFIDRSDFRLVDSPDYYGLAPNKEVGLRYAYNITCVSVVKNDKGDVEEIHATVDKKKERKPKGHLHWVNGSCHTAEIRLYDNLFKSREPAGLENWLEDINPHSLIVVKNAIIDDFLFAAKRGDKFQFERVGYFCVDEKDSTPEKPVWNRTVTLKDAYHK
jgi:glutaminyl-tRNA synthetase